MQNDPRTCGSPEHAIHRRQFLQGMAAGGAASMFSFGGLFGSDALAEQVAKDEKRCILLFLCGGPSQFETWDPKPGRPTSGPFGSIATNLPGIRVSELMPQSSRILDKLAIIRSMKTEPTEHFQAIDVLTRGEQPRPPFVRPILGSAVAEQLGHLERAIPSFVFLDPCPGGNEFRSFKAGDWPGWLGGKFGPVRAGGEFSIPNIEKLDNISPADHADREALRQFFSKRYENQLKSAAANSYNASFEQVDGIMSCAPLFDLERLPQKDRERYGPGAFAQHTLLARHLVENGSTFVMVANGMPWDCHILNHELHQMLVPELDHVIAQLLGDLEDRGMMENTLVLIMGEFGRTPWMNESGGRDHFPNAWSLAMAGAGVKPGIVYGGTDEDGRDVIDKPVDHRRLFATIFAALGIDPHTQYDLPGLPTFHRVEQDAEPIREVLS